MQCVAAAGKTTKNIQKKYRNSKKKGQILRDVRLSYIVYICAEDDVRKMEKIHVYKELQIYIIL